MCLCVVTKKVRRKDQHELFCQLNNVRENDIGLHLHFIAEFIDFGLKGGDKPLVVTKSETLF